MFVVDSYTVAVLMCIVTMLCWGSWANTQKLVSKEWRFQLFYWDYAIGVVILSLILAFTMGSMGSSGRPFLEDLKQAGGSALGSAFLGGVVFNVANILLVAAIDIAGLAVAFPIGIGIALVQGVIVNYIGQPEGNASLLFLGVALVAVAIVVNAIAYNRLPSEGQRTVGKGIVISIVAGVLMGFFYRFVAASMSEIAKMGTTQGSVLGQGTAGGSSALYMLTEAGKLSPYTAIVLFSLGLFASNFLWNSLVMRWPFVGDPVPFGDYFTMGSARLHLVGILGGLIWNVGMSFSIIASSQAGFAVSYGLGQGATLVAAFWGVFVWKEFKAAPPGTSKLLGVMFLSYVIGLSLIIVAKIV